MRIMNTGGERITSATEVSGESAIRSWESKSKERKSWQIGVSLVYGTLALVLDYYRTLPPRKSVWLYLVGPLVLLVLFRQPLRVYGVRLGNWKWGLALTLGGSLLTTPLLWWVAQQPAMQAYYAHIWARGGIWPTLQWAVADLIAWEFFFRGFLLFTLAEIAGSWAILLQAMLFTLGHLSKPEVETWSCIIGGSAFGWVAWKTQSALYPLLLHIFISVFTVWATTL